MFRAPGTCQANPPAAGPQHSMSHLVPRTPPTPMKLLPWPVGGGLLLSQSSSHPTPGIHSWFLQGETRRPFTHVVKGQGQWEVQASGTKWSRAPGSERETQSQLRLDRHCHSYFSDSFSTSLSIGPSGGSQMCGDSAPRRPPCHAWSLMKWPFHMLVAGFWATHLYLCRLLLWSFYLDFY